MDELDDTVMDQDNRDDMFFTIFFWSFQTDYFVVKIRARLNIHEADTFSQNTKD